MGHIQSGKYFLYNETNEKNKYSRTFRYILHNLYGLHHNPYNLHAIFTNVTSLAPPGEFRTR